MSKRILITGGLGYVGGRICKFLSENTDYELIITDLRKGITTPSWLKNGKIIHIDLASSYEEIESVCRNIDIVIHLAAINEIESARNPEKALFINGLGTLKLLESAEKNKVQRFIYFSTAHVYGAPLKGLITEETLPRAVHPYAITHKVAEDFILASLDNKKLEAIVVRMSNSFGAPIMPDVDRWTLLVNDLCKQAVTTKRLVLKSSGLQVRDFVTLEDVSRTIDHFIKLPKDKLDNGIFNLGGDKTLSVLDMTIFIAERCKIILGFYPEIVKQESNVKEKVYALNYKIEKLKNTGFDLLSNFNKEIDNMLVFCNELFK